MYVCNEKGRQEKLALVVVVVIIIIIIIIITYIHTCGAQLIVMRATFLIHFTGYPWIQLIVCTDVIDLSHHHCIQVHKRGKMIDQSVIR